MTELAISKIIPNDEQVRKSWDDEGIAELSESIKNEGLIVPIKVRPIENEHYEVVYGHRRLEACRRAGLIEIEAIIDGLDNNGMLTQAMIENIAREDMNDADISDGLKQLKRETGKTNAEIGAMFGKSEAWVRHLTNISDAEKTVLKSYPGTIGERHVREVRAGIKDEKYQLEVLKKVANDGLTARQARIEAGKVEQAHWYGGEAEARRELAKPYTDAEYEYSPFQEPPVIERPEKAAWQWETKEVIIKAREVFSNFNNLIDLLFYAEQDPKAARIILNQFEGYMIGWLGHIRTNWLEKINDDHCP